MLTTYITDNNVVSKQIANVICKEVIPGAGGAITSAYNWMTGTASSAVQSGRQGLQNMQQQAQNYAIQQGTQAAAKEYLDQHMGHKQLILLSELELFLRASLNQNHHQRRHLMPFFFSQSLLKSYILDYCYIKDLTFSTFFVLLKTHLKTFLT